MAALYPQFLAHYGQVAGQDLFLQLRGLLEANQVLGHEGISALEEGVRCPLFPLQGRDGSEDGRAWFHSSAEQREGAAALVPGVLSSLLGDLGRVAGGTPAILWAFPLIEQLMREQPDLHETARQLLFEGRDALSIKLAFLILGALRTQAQGDELDGAMLLGRHEEFAWFVSRYLFQKLENPEAQLWELAMANQGWGRLMTLKVLLLLFERRPVPLPLCRWLWQSGYRNTVSVGYTAVDILIQARLKEMLLLDQLEEATMVGVQTVLESALPQIEWSRWPDAPEVFRGYRRHAGQRYRTDFLPPQN